MINIIVPHRFPSSVPDIMSKARIGRPIHSRLFETKKTFITSLFMKMHWLLRQADSSLTYSSVGSPICQKGQSERIFPIFAFSSRFFLFFPTLRDFPPLFLDFWHFFFAVRGGTLPPCPQWLRHCVLGL